MAGRLIIMHIITQKKIWDAQSAYPEAAEALDGWYRIMKRNTFSNFAEVKNIFNSVDKVANYFVFDVGGNKLRLITTIHFNRKKVYIRSVLTHKMYDRGLWKN